MRIAAFEVREDERAEFARQVERPGVDELALHTEALDREHVGLVRGYDAAFVLGTVRYDEELLAAIADAGVRVLATRTRGMDHIDLDAARKVGLSVFNTSYAPDSVADFTIMLMLVALRRYKPAVYRQNVNDFSLVGLQGRTLSTLTVGIVGTGAIGAAVAQRLQGFGCRVIAWSRHENPVLEGVATYVSWGDLLAQADVITFHLPATAETHHIINADSLAHMRDGVVLVNTARADLMDVTALIDGIETGKIGALAMDVFDGESEIYHQSHLNDIIANRDMAYLRQFPNTVLTQHMAFYTREAVDQMVAGAVDAALSC